MEERTFIRSGKSTFFSLRGKAKDGHVIGAEQACRLGSILQQKCVWCSKAPYYEIQALSLKDCSFVR